MCTLEKRGKLFILTLTGENKNNNANDDQHSLTPASVSSLRAALAEARSQAVDGSVLITLAPGKFFSNGGDVKNIPAGSYASDVLHLVELLRGLTADMIALPMPTIAAVTGHAAGSGGLFAMCHDYIIMTSSKGLIYLSEMDIGICFPDYGSAVVRAKVGSASAQRDLLLGGVKVKGDVAAAMGIVDRVYDSEEEVVGAAMRLGEELGNKRWCCEAYAENRKILYPELCGLLGLKHQLVLPQKSKL